MLAPTFPLSCGEVASAPLRQRFAEVALSLDRLRAAMRARERAADPALSRLAAPQRHSARNLLHYLALRSIDLRALQDELTELGLSSLGRAEAAVLPAVDAVRALARLVASAEDHPADEAAGPAGLGDGRLLLRQRTEALLGPEPPAADGREVRIMVTMPSEAAEGPGLIRDLLAGGMDCMRINCAHDGPEAWRRMIDHLARARDELGRPCRVQMDLAGPKLRTGALPPGEQVLKWRPQRSARGLAVAPARVWLTPQESPHPPVATADAVVPLPAAFLAHLQPGERLRFTDARGASRGLRVVGPTERGCWAECWQTVYLAPGDVFHRELLAEEEGAGPASAAVGPLPARQGELLLRVGDRLLLTREPVRPEDGAGGGPARVSCTLPEVFADVLPGQPIWLDDGKVGGVVVAASPAAVEVLITRAAERGVRLRSDKGINLPESRLSVPALTGKDLDDLTFVARHADLVGYSFVRRAADVEELQRHLALAGGEHLGIVLKIETRQAFENLPELLLAALRSPRAGVMIARGDLAVECGYERLAEVQEEILWLCEAAHLPVIWATQVLETLARTGQPSRAEITDAAMGERAECVMLNKGPHVVEAVRVLADVLTRMQAHQRKKRALLRRLRVAGGKG